MTLNHHRYDPRSPHSLASVCRQRTVDLVHSHLEKSNISALIATRATGCPTVIHEHGAVLGGGSRLAYRLLLRRLGHRAHAAVACSAATRAALVRTGGFAPARVLTISSFVDVRRFERSATARSASRKRLGVEDGTNVIGFIGRLHRAKGADRFLRALAHLDQHDRPCLGIVVGDGPERLRLERIVQRRGLEQVTVMLGATEAPEEIIPAFDVGVVPSRREGFGRVAVELMCAGVPVVASAVDALPELVRHEDTGLLVPDPTPAGLAAAIRRLLADPALRDRITGSARQLVRQHDGTTQTRRLIDLYDRVVQGDRP
jgi:glycosyltransferase involved in cell wall biosynthesis